MNGTKFKIGDEIFFMDYKEPKKETIKGIAIVHSEFKTTGFEAKQDENGPAVLYHTGGYSMIPEGSAFASKEEMIASVFKGV